MSALRRTAELDARLAPVGAASALPLPPALVIAALALVFQLGCAIGPNYQQPAVDVPETYRDGLKPSQAESLADLPWWQVFEDPVLVELIDTALRNNLNLEIAVARTEQASRQASATNSAFFPQATYGGSGGKTKAAIVREPGMAIEYSNYAGALNVAWEIDLWGRIRRASEAARAQLLASEDFQRGVLLSVVADVASLYFALLELDATHGIATDAVEAFTETLDLFTRKFEGGIASKLEVTRAAAAQAQAEASLPAVEIDIAALENQLSILLGRPPGKLSRGSPLIDQHMPELPPGLPSKLMERRPDIRQAEQQVISANAQVGVAMGNFLPRVGLVSMWGGTSETLGDLTSGSTSLWNLAGELSGPLFKGGLLYAEYKAQQAVWEESKANYELTALNAFAEVSNALVERRLRKDQRIAQEKQVAQLDESVSLSLARYEQGLANYFEVLQAQQDLFPAMLNLSKSRLDERLATIKLYRALGGGWKLNLEWLPDMSVDKEGAETPGAAPSPDAATASP